MRTLLICNSEDQNWHCQKLCGVVKVEGISCNRLDEDGQVAAQVVHDEQEGGDRDRPRKQIVVRHCYSSEPSRSRSEQS